MKRQNHWTIKYRSMTYIYLMRSIYVSYGSIKTTITSIHQIILKMLSKITRPCIYRSCWPVFILRSKFESHCLIIWKYDTHSSNSLWDIRQNHWTMKYKSQWPTFILRSNVGSYWFIIPNKDAHSSNNLQDIMKRQWTMKYRSHWPAFYFAVKRWVILIHYPK